MESATQEAVKLETNIRSYANWKTQSEFGGGDPIYHAFLHVMKQRRMHAQDYLKAESEAGREYNLTCLESCNKQLRDILGL